MPHVRPFSPVIVAPTFNNAATLRSVLERLLYLNVPVIVVDDGSTDATRDILATLQSQLRVVTHPANHGKAMALRSGFDAATEMGATHAVTIDTDGQLDPAEVPAIIELARQSPRALVLGVRDDSAADYPARSRIGRRISNALVRLECGLRVADSQCGLRVYPLDQTRRLRCTAGHYEFETEVITRFGWSGGQVREMPVSCRYLPPGQRVSHFRPWLDSLRAVRMHAWLMLQRLAYWLSPYRAWRELREQPAAPRELACGLAIGVFIANLPLYGVQTLLSLYAAKRLRINPLAVIAGSHISTPPIGPALVAAAIGLGHYLLHGNWLAIPHWQHGFEQWLRLAGSLLLEWTIGAMLIGSALAIVTFFVSHVLLRALAARHSGDAEQLIESHRLEPARPQ